MIEVVLIIFIILAGFIIYLQHQQNAALLDRLLGKNSVKPLQKAKETPRERSVDSTLVETAPPPPPGFLTQADADEQTRDFIEEYVEEKLYGREFKSEMERSAAIKQQIGNARKILEEQPLTQTPYILIEDE